MTSTDPPPPPPPPPPSSEAGRGGVPLDASRPQAARRYNALLGGKDNFSADRAAAEDLTKAFPDARTAAAENRRFVLRMVHHLAADRGIRQFLDIGSGLPTDLNVHDIAQRVHPDARIVYADHDPVVAAHSRALLIGTAEGHCEFIPADLRHPGTLLAHPTLRATLHPNQPVGVLIMAVLHFIPDTDHPYEAVRALLDGLPAGSHLALSHGTADLLPTAIQTRLAKVAKDPTQGTLVSRTRDQVSGFADGLHLIEPGVAPIVHWLPKLDPAPCSTPAEAPVYGLLARTPT